MPGMPERVIDPVLKLPPPSACAVPTCIPSSEVIMTDSSGPKPRPPKSTELPGVAVKAAGETVAFILVDTAIGGTGLPATPGFAAINACSSLSRARTCARS